MNHFLSQFSCSAINFPNVHAGINVSVTTSNTLPAEVFDCIVWLDCAAWGLIAGAIAGIDVLVSSIIDGYPIPQT